MGKEGEPRGNQGRRSHHDRERLPDMVRAGVIMRVKTTDTVIGRGKTHPGNMLKKVQDLKDYQEAHQNGTEVINGLSLLMNVWLHIYESIRKKILLIILKLPFPPSFFLFLFLFCLLFAISLYEELLAVNIAILSHLKQGCQTYSQTFAHCQWDIC